MPERGERYDLIGSSEALRRLVEGQPRPLSGGREPAVRCLDCPEPQPEPEPVVVTVTGVRLGLELVPAYDVEHTWLVPAYLSETTGGGPGPDLVTIAVSDDDLVPVPEPPPPSEPPVVAPSDNGPGRRCVGVVAAGVPGAGQPHQLEVCQVGWPGPASPWPSSWWPPTPTRASATTAVPVVTFGDEDGGAAVCEVACLSLPPGPGRLRRSFDHVYAEFGTYTATFTLIGCGSDAAADVSVDLPVTVTT